MMINKCGAVGGMGTGRGNRSTRRNVLYSPSTQFVNDINIRGPPVKREDLKN
jgi:hypothetical protein